MESSIFSLCGEMCVCSAWWNMHSFFKWTGSNTNPRNNDGQGLAGMDRSNLGQVTETPDHIYTSLVSVERCVFAQHGEIRIHSSGGQVQTPTPETMMAKVWQARTAATWSSCAPSNTQKAVGGGSDLVESTVTMVSTTLCTSTTSPFLAWTATAWRHWLFWTLVFILQNTFFRSILC